jgi:aldose 1-epimerase
MSMTSAPWGTAPDGTTVERVEIASDTVRLAVLTWGATVQSLIAPDRDGTPGDIVLGFDALAGYAANHPFLGATVGRYANRIAGASFELDDVTHTLPANDGPNTLHGGTGFHTRPWQLVDAQETPEGGYAELRLVSPDGDDGFPGALDVRTRFTVAGGVVALRTTAVTSAATVVNLTNHAYFNLHGPDRVIADHLVEVPADAFIAVDDAAIPLPGAPADVAGTPFDLRAAAPIGDRLGRAHDQLTAVGGIDHTFVLGPAEGSGLRTAGVVTDPDSGRRLTVRTTEPGVQVYTGNHLDGSLLGKGGAPLAHRTGLCLETQHFPDSPHRPDYPSTVLRPGEVFTTLTEWHLDTI